MRISSRMIGLTSVLFLAACSSNPSATPKAIKTPGAGSGTTIGSCVEQYNLGTLAKRSFAFDGTVRSVKRAGDEAGADEVTFTVGRWYKGGSANQVTLNAYAVGGVSSVGTISGQSGERLLVAGEDDIVWTCGFTQPYSPQVAAQWDTTFKAS